MEPANPYAPPSVSLDESQPRPVRSRWAALWWFPTGVFGSISVLFLMLTGLALFHLQKQATRLGMGHPFSVRMMQTAVICAVGCLGCGVIAYAWYRRRWVVALVLMPLCYAIGVATGYWLDQV